MGAARASSGGVGHGSGQACRDPPPIRGLFSTDLTTLSSPGDAELQCDREFRPSGGSRLRRPGEGAQTRCALYLFGVRKRPPYFSTDLLKYPRTMRFAHVALLLLLATGSARANIFDTIGGAISDAAGAVVGAGGPLTAVVVMAAVAAALLPGLLRQAPDPHLSFCDAGATAVDAVGGVASDVGDAVTGAGETAVDAVTGAATSAWDWTKNAANWVACKSVDLTVFNFDPCWEAPPSNLCTEQCKAELEKLPQSCVSAWRAAVRQQTWHVRCVEMRGLCVRAAPGAYVSSLAPRGSIKSRVPAPRHLSHLGPLSAAQRVPGRPVQLRRRRHHRPGGGAAGGLRHRVRP